MAQAQTDASARDPVSPTDSQSQSPMQNSLWRRFFGRDKDNAKKHGASPDSPDAAPKGPVSEQTDDKSGLIRRVSRRVVPGLPRAGTFKRQQSELRDKLEPIKQTPAERRAVSVDRRTHGSISAFSPNNPRTSAPDFLSQSYSVAASVPSLPTSPVEEKMLGSIGELNGIHVEEEDGHQIDDQAHIPDAISNVDAHSMTTSQYDSMIHDELERIWILNLSMHFRDKSKREKFFVTYRENNILWRRVTISLDYRNAPEGSLEMDLADTKFQRDKSAKIYEAIRESLGDIQFYDTVTNLKLQTTDGRLHVHVVEDVNEIIQYPTVRMIQHMRCRRIKERDLEFDSHMSGFVYKVRVNGEVLIKKEIPGPDTVDEFLYEINALNRLRSAENVIQFYGVVVDDKEEYIKGLLISYADQGALIDIIYDNNHSIPWSTREKWARQIVNGLAEIHEAGFVQGDFTLSNIVINEDNDAKIIDINRRGCPVGWEPPEATPLIESNQRISMYIGVKSDLFQLGMVLWALATQEDEPEAHGRPLRIGADIQVPLWYRQMVAICLSEDPRKRLQAIHLASMFPEPREESHYGAPNGSAISIDDRYSHHEFGADSFTASGARVKTVEQPHDWAYLGWNNPTTDDLYYYPTRGRSPPSPMPSNHGDASRYGHHLHPWSDKQHSALTAPSVSDVSHSELQTRSDLGLRLNVEPPTDSEKSHEMLADARLGGGERETWSPRKTTNIRTKADRPAGDQHAAFLDTKDEDRTLTVSHADSGKDLSESTATPKSVGSEVPRVVLPTDESSIVEEKDGNRRGSEYLGDPLRRGSQEDAIPDTTSDIRGPSLFTSTSFSSSRATSTSTPVREMPNELKGIGSAYDLTTDRRQDSMILDDDLGLDLAGSAPHSDPLASTSPQQQTLSASEHDRQMTTTAPAVATNSE